jgi:hypothetical protein
VVERKRGAVRNPTIGPAKRRLDDVGSSTMHPQLAGQILFRAVMVAVAFTLMAVTPAASQDPAEAPSGRNVLRVFLECVAPGCDATHFQREITFVDWVLEPQDGLVHVIVTSEAAGGGGRRYVADFMGRDTLEAVEDRFTHVASVTDVTDELRNALTRMLRLGLVRYAALAGFAESIDVRDAGAGEIGGGPPQTPREDAWDAWVFTMGLNGSGFSEDQSSSRSLGFSLGANRTTEAWKIDMNGRASFSRSEFQLTDSTVFEDERNTWNASAAAVRSVGEHWGLGTEIEGSNSVALNRDLLVGLGAGVEWDYFPYSESTRRSLLARYVVHVEHVDYDDTTIFDKDREFLLRHETGVTYSAREPWGTANLAVSANHFLNETEFYSVNFGGSVNYRIIRGLSLRFSLNHSIIHDQLYLSGEGLTDEERLLRRRQLATDSRTFYSVGLTFRFGSIFNNAVNTRFPSGVR